jgi:hypothetical protein
MPQPPELRIVRGSPTPEEEAAVRAAVLDLWRKERARASAAAGPNPWVLAGRIESTHRWREALPRTPEGWRRSGRIAAKPVSDNRIGRGDAR